MAIVSDAIDRRGPSKKIRYQLEPKKSILAFNRHFTYCKLLKRWSTLVLKVGVLYGW